VALPSETKELNGNLFRKTKPSMDSGETQLDSRCGLARISDEGCIKAWLRFKSGFGLFSARGASKLSTGEHGGFLYFR
jgi:hypothetical protein